MAHSRGFQRGPTTRTRRMTEWGDGPEARDESLSATGIGLWTTGITLITSDAVTIVRTRGLFSAFLRSTGAVGDGFFGAIGIGMVTLKAFIVGSTAIPGPLTEKGWDGWLYHSFIDVRSVTATIGDGVNSELVQVRHVIDSKAQRKWEAGSQVVLFGSYEVVESGASVVEFHADTRVLVKLS